MRVFVGSMLGPDNQAFYRRLADSLVECSDGLLRAVPAGSLHVTYAFLPQVDDAAFERVVEIVAAVAARHEVVVAGLGPPEVLLAGGTARLIHAPVTRGGEALSLLGRALADALAEGLADVPASGMRSPHVTLARYGRHRRRRRAAVPVADAIARLAASFVEREERVATIQVVQSTVTSAGPVYDVRAASELSARSTGRL
jgi:2'-5' RNA ligase